MELICASGAHDEQSKDAGPFRRMAQQKKWRLMVLH
jgi:hypothetical protein